MNDTPLPTPEDELRSFLDRLEPPLQKLAREVRAAVRKRLPTANELAYDYKTFVVLSYTPTSHGIDGVVSIAARPDGVRLYLSGGPKLPDPQKLLRGTAKGTRYVEVDAVRRLAEPEVVALIDAAIAQAKIPLPASGQGQLVIQTGGSKQKPKAAAKKKAASKPAKKAAAKPAKKAAAKASKAAAEPAKRAPSKAATKPTKRAAKKPK